MKYFCFLLFILLGLRNFKAQNKIDSLATRLHCLGRVEGNDTDRINTIKSQMLDSPTK